jgi:ketosteroid isomerase-like protein
MNAHDGADNGRLARDYLAAVGRKELGRVEGMLAPDLAFTGPAMSRSTAGEFIEALKRLGAIHVRNDVKHVFVDGDEVCVIYDFVTDTPAGALPTVEWLRMEAGRIAAIRLYYDRVPWKGVMEELTQRLARSGA